MKKISKNKKGFVMIETIIVISILAVGLLSLYSSYVLIINKTQKPDKDNSTVSYIAYELYNYKFYDSLGTISDPYYVEVYNMGDLYYKRDCGKSSGTAKCGSSTLVTSDEIAMLNNLNIDKVYYFNKTFNNYYDKDILLLFDGSTIEYLNEIKNNANINLSTNKTILIKRKANQKTYFSFYQKEDTVEYKSLRKKILGNNNNNVNESLSIPGIQITDNSETVLSSTMDDYGLSYYYRGTAENNYLVFANMCWRIVRITGSGAIKIVLYNYNDSDCTKEGNNLAFARFSGNTFTSKFNDTANKNTYVGYMYSNNPTSANYDTAHANDKDSTILTNLKTWYNNKFSDSQKDMLADVIWCNDKMPVNDTNYNISEYSNLKGTGLNTDITYYQTVKRLLPIENAKPSLVCSNANKLSKFTASDVVNGNAKLNGAKIGLLTADEIAFAGSTADTNNTSYYLNKNASSTSWFSMSPAKFANDTTAYVWGASPNGMLSQLKANSAYAIRPSIALLPSIEVTGEGTSDNPYIVIE